MRTLRTGLVGCGKVGHLHAAALRDLEESDFVAACARTPQKAETFGRQYGVAAFTSVEEMVSKAKLDVVCICTPHPDHAAPAIAAARAGAHVLVEKPLAATLRDCDAMIEAARAAGTVHRDGVAARVLSAVPADSAGDQRRETGAGPGVGCGDDFRVARRAWYRSDPWRGSWAREGGGVLVNQAPHQLDLLLWYLGEISEVSGFWAN